MSTKIIINASGVRELLSVDAGAVAELAKNAAAQVAATLKRELLTKPLDDALMVRIQAMISAGGTWSPKLTDKVRQLMTDFLKDECKAFVDKITSRVIRDQIAEHVRVLIAMEMDRQSKTLSEKADAILRERFAAMFAAKT